MMKDRYPRTLFEAFGPYTSTYFVPDPPICIFRTAWSWVKGWWNA